MMTSSKRLDFQYYIRFFNHFCITEIAFNKLINPFRKLGVASDYSLPKSYFPKGKMQSESNVYFAPLSLSDHLLSGIYPLKIKSSIKTSSRQIQGLELIIQTEFSYFRTPFINKTRTFEILQTFQHFWNTLCNKLQLFKPITFTTYNRIWPNNFGQVNSKYR